MSIKLPLLTTDSKVLQSLAEQRWRTIKRQVESFLPQLEKKRIELTGFTHHVYERVKGFQERSIAIPPRGELQIEKEYLLDKYRRFKAIYEKGRYLAKKLDRSVNFAREIKWEGTHETSLKQLQEQQILLGKLFQKYTGLVWGPALTASLLTLSDIVDNLGEPVSWTKQTGNNLLVRIAHFARRCVDPEITILFIQFLRRSRSPL